MGDRLEDQLQRFAIRFQARREAAFVADTGRDRVLQRRAQRMKDLRAGPQGLGKRRRANRHHHELLHVDV